MMDFHTRDEYRHSVEKSAKFSILPESVIARMALDMAKIKGFLNRPDYPAAHLGYYLIGNGTKQLVKESEPVLVLVNRSKIFLENAFCLCISDPPCCWLFYDRYPADKGLGKMNSGIPGFCW